MTRPGPPSGHIAGDVVAYLVAGGRDQVDGGHSTETRPRIGFRQLESLRAQLSDRDLAVIESLSLLHYATTLQLTRLHFTDPDTSARVALRKAERALARLRDLAALERLQRRTGGPWAGSSPNLWRLSPAGRRLVNDTTERARLPGVAHLAHELAVSELVVRIHEAARQGHFEILAVETSPACWRPYTGRRRKRLWLKPDLRLTLGVGNIERHWFVEVDRGTEHRPALRRKIHAYQAAWHDGAEHTRAGVFPRVLWVVPDARRAAVLDEECSSATGTPPGLFAVTTTDRAPVALAGPTADHEGATSRRVEA